MPDDHRPSISFEQARQIIDRHLRPDWDLGTFHVDAEGYEDANYWRVNAGPLEAMGDDTDLEFLVCGMPAFLVAKSTGAIREVPIFANLEWMGSMTPVAADPNGPRRLSPTALLVQVRTEGPDGIVGDTLTAIDADHPLYAVWAAYLDRTDDDDDDDE